MSFLLGAFGFSHTSPQAQRLLRVASQQAQSDSLQTMIHDHAIIVAGQNQKHQKAYNHIFSLDGTNGILVGKLFDRNYSQPFTKQNALAGQFGHNQHLLYKNFWGRFVGALYNQTTNSVTLVRDPLGLSTLFYIEQPEGVLFSTDISLLYDILETKPALDYAYFAEYVMNKNQALPSTPFKNIKELLPGMGLTIDSQGRCTQELLWDISELKGLYITDEREAEEALLATLKSSIKAWTLDTDGVCIELSGGLDSSAVLITLREVLPDNKKLIAVNCIDSMTPSSNENEYAQEVADICDVPLHLLDWHGSSLISDLPAGWLPNRPSTFLLSHTSAQEFYNFSTSNGCSELVNGQGGDHIFLAPAPKNSLADYWLDHGFKGITKPLKSLSAAYRMPLVPLIKESGQAIADYYRKNHVQQHTNEKVSYLTKEYTHELKKHDFYLKDALTSFYPAKATHLESLCHAVSYADRDQRFQQAVMSHPLLSLPIVEMGLKIPTYQSFNDGFDRIFFRRAAAKMKKSKTLWRTIKGQTTGTMTKSFVREADTITDLLVDGTLIKSGMIDKQWLDNELINIRHGKADDLWPLMHLITCQLWLNQWKL